VAGGVPEAAVPVHPALARASELFRDSRWHEAAEAAARAVGEDPDDARAWALLGTSRFLAGDAEGALAAWSRERLPTLDGFTISGLRRTRHSVVQAFLGLTPGRPLSRGGLARARRRLALLPSVGASSLALRILPGRLAVVEGTATEPRTLPRGGAPLAAAALHAAVSSEAHVNVAAPAGGGEAFLATVRWAEARPGAELAFTAPAAPLPGVVGLATGWQQERHRGPGDDPPRAEERRHARLWITDWATGWLRWEIAAGAERWRIDTTPGPARYALGVVATEVELSPPGRGVSLEGSVEGARSIDASGGWLHWRLRATAAPLPAQGGWRVSLVGLAGGASRAAPRTLWPGADARGAREGLLRAHPAERDGALSGETLAPGLLSGSLELERRVLQLPVGRIGVAVFMDIARFSYRGSWDTPSADSGHLLLVDTGAGLRLELPIGRLRLDAALGRAGARAVSAAWSAALP
jgi:hypothetical protein